MIRTIFIGILTLILIPLGLNAAWEWWHRINPEKIIGYYPYANDYSDANGQTYKNASASPIENMERSIDSRAPLPLKFGEKNYKLTLGIKNLNSNQLVNVYLFLKLPKDVIATKDDGWAKNSENEYYAYLGTINPDMLVRDPQPIYIAVSKPGRHILTYNISGNFPIIRDRPIPINVYTGKQGQ